VAPGRPLEWTWLGRIDFAAAVALQEETRARIISGDAAAERVFLCEHPPVITLGRRARSEHVLASEAELAARGIAVAAASRGGDVTAHGPGQLVIYPVVRLRRGVRAHVCGVGLAIVEWLHALGVTSAQLSRDPVGVFVADRGDGVLGAAGGARPAKIAACGVHVSHRVAIHGWAVNVTREPLALFASIVPCGLAGVPVTSLSVAQGRADDDPALALAALARALGERVVARLDHLAAAGDAPREPEDVRGSSCDLEPAR
jgi:lipoyl(octanoyl) transferase